MKPKLWYTNLWRRDNRQGCQHPCFRYIHVFDDAAVVHVFAQDAMRIFTLAVIHLVFA